MARTNVVAAADALGDLEYVVNGMALGMGIPLPEVVAEIHRSNMTKLGEDGKPIYREDGKILKGPGYEEPQLLKVLGL
jgi:predicted HAD superfamily Cof-like phosphohydrolase